MKKYYLSIPWIFFISSSATVLLISFLKSISSKKSIDFFDLFVLTVVIFISICQGLNVSANDESITCYLFNKRLKFIPPINYSKITNAGKYIPIMYWIVCITKNNQAGYLFLMISRKSMIEICRKIHKNNKNCVIDKSILKKIKNITAKQ